MHPTILELISQVSVYQMRIDLKVRVFLYHKMPTFGSSVLVAATHGGPPGPSSAAGGFGIGWD